MLLRSWGIFSTGMQMTYNSMITVLPVIQPSSPFVSLIALRSWANCIDSGMSYTDHVTRLTQTCFFHIHQLRSIRDRSLWILRMVRALILMRLDAVRENDARGPSVYHTILFMRSIIFIAFCTFIELYAQEVWNATAKTVRPREKSFIRPIRQIANKVGSSNPRMTSEVRKCPKRRFFADIFFQQHRSKVVMHYENVRPHGADLA